MNNKYKFIIYFIISALFVGTLRAGGLQQGNIITILTYTAILYLLFRNKNIFVRRK